MQIAHFGHGLGFVAHKYRVPGSNCRFSVWFNRDGYATSAERIDSCNRVYEPTTAQWEYIRRHRIAGLSNETEINQHREKGLTT